MILAQDSLLNRPFKRSEPVSKKQWCGAELGNLETERKPRSFVQHCKTPFVRHAEGHLREGLFSSCATVDTDVRI